MPPPERPRLPPPRPAAGAPPPPSPHAVPLAPTVPAPRGADHRVVVPAAPPPPRGFSTQPLPAGMNAPVAGMPRLYVLHRGRHVAVDKPRWLIGRDPKTADLAIEDSGVSRRHAMVEAVEGRWTMVDLGSTNGVAYNGYRLARKEIVGGDVFVISGHELRFWFE